MFPPRTEAPTADKLALCYAPHVDMTTVIEVEVCFSTKHHFSALIFTYKFFIVKFTRSNFRLTLSVLNIG